jgi:hypothetical protein
MKLPIIVHAKHKWLIMFFEDLRVTPGLSGTKSGASHTCAKKKTYIITECVEINVTITSEYLLHSGSLITK